MKILLVNQLIEYIDDNRIERVLWVDLKDDRYVVIDIHDKKALPLFRTHNDLDKLMQANAIRLSNNEPYLKSHDECEINNNHAKLRDRNWRKIKSLVMNQPAIFDSNERGVLISRLVNENNESRHSLYRLLRRYWQRGLTPNALLPDYEKCGGYAKEKNRTNKPVGRQPEYRPASIVVTKEIREIFKSAVDKHYAKNSKMNFKECYDGMIARWFAKEKHDEKTGNQTFELILPYPSIRQFRYWYEKDNDIGNIRRMRVGDKIYDKDMRGVLGSSTTESMGPGFRYQIDATIADTYLVSRYDKQAIVGRPTLYVVIDVFSHMITGIYVGLEPPSWQGAMQALINAILPKVEYCQNFGIDISDNDWPCSGMPERILGDRGEMAGRMVETLINMFGVNIENTAPYRADWKGIVEQRFKLLPAVFKAYTPGYIESDFEKRGGRDYRLDATLDIDQFTRLIIRSVLYYNNYHILQHYPMMPRMLTDGISPIPAEIWEWGVSNCSGVLKSYPEEQVRFALLPSEQVSITKEGILLFGCYYTCAMAIREKWFDEARQNGRSKVKASYDPLNMSRIYLHGKKGQPRFIECTLTEKSRWHKDKTLWEISQLNELHKKYKAEAEAKTLTGKVTLISSIQQIVNEANTGQKGSTKLSDRERIQGIRANRRDERARINEERLNKDVSVRLDGKVIDIKVNEGSANYDAPNILEIMKSFEPEE